MKQPRIQVSVPDQAYWRRQIKCQAECPSGTDARGYVRAIGQRLAAGGRLHSARSPCSAPPAAGSSFGGCHINIGSGIIDGVRSTGCLLPRDQLAFWAITIGSNIAQSRRELTNALEITR